MCFVCSFYRLSAWHAILATGGGSIGFAFTHSLIYRNHEVSLSLYNYNYNYQVTNWLTNSSSSLYSSCRTRTRRFLKHRCFWCFPYLSNAGILLKSCLCTSLCLSGCLLIQSIRIIASSVLLWERAVMFASRADLARFLTCLPPRLESTVTQRSTWLPLMYVCVSLDQSQWKITNKMHSLSHYLDLYQQETGRSLSFHPQHGCP